MNLNVVEIDKNTKYHRINEIAIEKIFQRPNDWKVGSLKKMK